jgi:hypothetical protein
MCAVCAAKITEHRRKELAQAVTTWQDRQNLVVMMTLTAPHKRTDIPKEMVDRLVGSALKKFHNRTPWREWAQAAGLRGSVRALEYTIGQNGPHVHLHILLFIENLGKSISLPTAVITESWMQACRDAGLTIDDEQAFRLHGLRLTVGRKEIGDYVSKWGLDLEMTKQHVKHGRGPDGLTPWDLLRATNGHDEYARQFQAYAHAFFNRRQLVWSKGLRELLGLKKEKTDAEIAEGHEEQATFVGPLSDDDLRRMWRHDVGWQALIAVERCGAEGLARIKVAWEDRELRDWYRQQQEGCNDS